MLAVSCSLLTEKAPMEGGMAFSVPLSRKVVVYTLLDRIAAQRGLRFNTCGCKDLRLRAAGVVPTVCRNTAFLEEHSQLAPDLTRPGGRPIPGIGARSAPPTSPRASRIQS